MKGIQMTDLRIEDQFTEHAALLPPWHQILSSIKKWCYLQS